jgi:hypothetical protein
VADLPGKGVEEKVLASLQVAKSAMDLDTLIARVRDRDTAVRAVDVKIAALNLVSTGRVDLNEAWQLSPHN